MVDKKKFYANVVVDMGDGATFNVTFCDKETVQSIRDTCLLHLVGKAMAVRLSSRMAAGVVRVGRPSKRVKMARKLQRKKQVRAVRQKFNDNLLKRVSVFYDKNTGITLPKIAKHFGLTMNNLTYILRMSKSRGYITNPRPKGGFKTKKAVEKIDKMLKKPVVRPKRQIGYPAIFRRKLVGMVLADPSLPLDELSEEYGPKPITIYSWIKKHTGRKPNVTWTRKYPTKKIAKDSLQIPSEHVWTDAEKELQEKALIERRFIPPSEFSFEFSNTSDEKTRHILDMLFDDDKMLRYDRLHRDLGFKGRIPCSKWFKFLAEVDRYYKCKDKTVRIIWIPHHDGLEAIKGGNVQFLN